MKARNIPVVVISIVLVLTSAGCGLSLGQAPTPVPTNTQVPPTAIPTNTPEPTATFTPLPTDTPTATPDLKATEAALNEQAARDMLTELELPADSGQLIWMQGDPISIPLNGPDYDFKSFDDSVKPGNFAIYSEVTWKTDSWPECGIAFRSTESDLNANFYLLRFLRLSGLPAFFIDYYKQGNYLTTITDVKFSSYLDLDDGATNKILLYVDGNQFKFYINGHYEGVYYDWSKLRSDGTVFFFADQNAGKTTCTFDKSWIWNY